MSNSFKHIRTAEKIKYRRAAARKAGEKDIALYDSAVLPCIERQLINIKYNSRKKRRAGPFDKNIRIDEAIFFDAPNSTALSGAIYKNIWSAMRQRR